MGNACTKDSAVDAPLGYEGGAPISVTGAQISDTSRRPPPTPLAAVSPPLERVVTPDLEVSAHVATPGNRSAAGDSGALMVALAPDGPGCPDPPESFESRLEMEFERGVFSPACRPQQVDEGCAAITGATDRFALYGASLWMTVDQRIEWQYAPRLAPHGIRSEPLHRGNFAFTFGSGKKPSCCE